MKTLRRSQFHQPCMFVDAFHGETTVLHNVKQWNFSTVYILTSGQRQPCSAEVNLGLCFKRIATPKKNEKWIPTKIVTNYSSNYFWGGLLLHVCSRQNKPGNIETYCRGMIAHGGAANDSDTPFRHLVNSEAVPFEPCTVNFSSQRTKFSKEKKTGQPTPTPELPPTPWNWTWLTGLCSSSPHN